MKPQQAIQAPNTRGTKAVVREVTSVANPFLPASVLVVVITYITAATFITPLISIIRLQTAVEIMDVGVGKEKARVEMRWQPCGSYVCMLCNHPLGTTAQSCYSHRKNVHPDMRAVLTGDAPGSKKPQQIVAEAKSVRYKRYKRKRKLGRMEVSVLSPMGMTYS